MALEFYIDTGLRLVTLTGVEVPDFDEWRRAMLNILAHPDFRPGFNFLTDRRDAQQAPTTDYLRQVVEFLEDHRAELAHCRWALVVSTPAGFGMGRMAMALCEGLTIRVQVFTNLRDARVWLGVRGLPTPV